MSFVSELKRRKVFQVAAVYLVVAWLIMQVVDVVNEPLRLPEWFATVAILIVAIGFPIALILSWAFDLTPEGVVKDQGTNIVVQSSGRRMEYVFMGLLVIAVATLLYREFSPPEQVVEVVAEESQREVLPNSVAVLPFTNLSPDPDDEYFAAGIHEELLNQLVKIRDLTVISRTSVLKFPNSGKSVAEIAAELNVETIMEGTVRYGGDRVRITAQLIDPTTGGHLWSETYEYEFAVENIFTIESDIAVNIAMALEAELLPSERENIERIPTDFTEAYALYLRALAELGADTGLNVSEEARSEFHRYLDEAIEIDPNFALAYAEKSREYAYSLARDRRLSDETTIMEIENLVRQNAQNALALDHELGVAHAALAVIHRVNKRWAESRASYELALQSSPNDPSLLLDYMYFNFTVGQITEAVALGKQLVATDPSASGYNTLGVALFWSGDYDAAADVYRRAIEINPAHQRRHRHLGAIEANLGFLTRATEELRLSESLGGADASITDLAILIYWYGRTGSSEDAERLFGALQDRANEYYIGAGIWALATLGVGERQQALAWLKKAAETPSPDNGYVILYVIAGNLYADPILDQPEFVEVRRRLGFRE